MYNDFDKDKDLIIEIQILTDKVEEFKEAIDAYCLIMKESFLNMSNQN